MHRLLLLLPLPFFVLGLILLSSPALDAQPLESIPDFETVIDSIPHDRPTTAVVTMAVSPDGSQLAAMTGDGNTWLWQVSSARVVLQIPPLPGDRGVSQDKAVRRLQESSRLLQFGGDGRYLAITAGDQFQVYDLQKPNTVAIFKGPSKATAVQLGRGHTMAFVEDGAIVVRDLRRGRNLARLESDTVGPCYLLRLSADNRQVLGRHGSRFTIWDVGTGEHSRSWSSQYSAPLRDFGFANEHEIWTLHGGLWDRRESPDGDLIREVDVPEVPSVAVDTERIFAGRNRLYLLDRQFGDEVLAIEGTPEDISQLAAARDVPIIAGFSSEPKQGAKIYLWDLRTESQIATLEPLGRPVRAVAISPTNRYLVTASAGGLARIWSLTSGRLIAAKNLGARIDAMKFLPDGRLAVALADGLVLWEAAHDRIERLHEFSGPRVPVRHIGISRYGELAVGYAKAWIGRVDGSEIQTFVGRGFSLANADIPHDRGWVLAASQRGVLGWNIHTGKQMREFRLGGREATDRVLVHPDDQKFAASVGDYQVRVFDVKQETELYTVGIDTAGNLAGFDFSPDGKTLALAYHDHYRLMFYDADTGEPVQQTTVHHQKRRLSAVDVTFSPDGKQLAVAFAQGMAKVWNLEGESPKLAWTFLAAHGGDWLSCRADGQCRRSDSGHLVQRADASGRLRPIPLPASAAATDADNAWPSDLGSSEPIPVRPPAPEPEKKAEQTKKAEKVKKPTTQSGFWTIIGLTLAAVVLIAVLRFRSPRR